MAAQFILFAIIFACKAIVLHFMIRGYENVLCNENSRVVRRNKALQAEVDGAIDEMETNMKTMCFLLCFSLIMMVAYRYGAL